MAATAITTVATVMALSQNHTGLPLLCRDRNRRRDRLERAGVDALLDHVAEMPDQALDGPSGRVAERADGMALDLIADIEQHIDLGLLGLALGHAFEHAPHPTGALAARRALAAGFILVEIGDASDGADDVGRFVHDDHAGGAEPGLQRLETVEVHPQIAALARRNARNRRAAGNDGKEIVPAAAHAAAIAVDQLAQPDPHLLLDIARGVDVARE